jgi:hypothetical protein
METTDEIRADALSRLRQAQHMIEEGRKELAAAHEKIRMAQELIDQSAEALRENPPANRPAAHSAEHDARPE